MTEHGHNFIREIAEAYRALESEPDLKRQVHDFEGRHIRDGDTIARLETRIMELKAAQDELNTKLRSVEAERDEAGFRQLEAEDKVATLVHTFQVVHSTVGQAVAAGTGSERDITVLMSPQEKAELESFKAEQLHKAEEATRKAEQDCLAAEEAARPKPEPVYPQAVPSEPVEVVNETYAFGIQGQAYSKETGLPVQPMGQSEPLPTSDMAPAVPESGLSPSAPTQPVTTESAPQSEGDMTKAHYGDIQPRGKYFGKRYAEWDYYVPLSSWLEGGGTEEDYHWRPAAI